MLEQHLKQLISLGAVEAVLDVGLDEQQVVQGVLPFVIGVPQHEPDKVQNRFRPSRLTNEVVDRAVLLAKLKEPPLLMKL